MKRNIVVCIAALFLVFAAPSQARTFNSPGSMSKGEYKYVENPDGTSTEYYQGGSTDSTIIQGDTYSAEAMAESDRLFGQIATDAGTSGQNGSIFIGSNGRNIYAAERIVQDFQTGEPWRTIGEKEVGDQLITEGVDLGTLPDLSATVSASAGAVLGVGAGLVGVAIGTGIDELLGWPSLRSVIFGGGGYSEKGIFFESGPFDTWEWQPHIQLQKLKLCSEMGFPNPFTSGTFTGEECMHLDHQYKLTEEWESEKTWHKTETYHAVENYAGDSYLHISCPIDWTLCYEHEETPESKFRSIYAPMFVVGRAAFPAKGLKSFEHTITPPTSGSVEAMPGITVPHVIPTTVPAPARHVIIEKAKDPEEKPLVPPIEEPGPEEKPIPGPLLPEIPKPGHDELYTQYKTTLESDGFTDIEEVILPEDKPDEEVGPGDVTGVEPSPGSRVEPSTKVRVGVNPDTSPPPPETPGKVGPPTLPGFNLPNLGVLCKGFPFGVPCWLWETVESWSASGVAPEWGIGGWEIAGHKVPDTKFKLSALEPVMEKVRPAILIFATIGIVLLFYKLAKGGSPPSGGGGDSGAVEVDIPEGGGTYWES